LWFVDLKNAGGSAGKGKIEGADSTLTMDGKDFFDMFSGKSLLESINYFYQVSNFNHFFFFIIIREIETNHGLHEWKT
jgi:hypothetical protein